MGYSIAWLAVRGKPRSAILSELGLRVAGESGDNPFSSDPCGTDLPGGWYMVSANGCDFVDELPLDRLSIAAELVTCSVEEHVMVSWASGWSDGQQVWFVMHDSERGIEQVEVEGDLPQIFTSIYERLAAEQAEAGGEESDVDYLFDVPVELAKALTGFRHDETFSQRGTISYDRLQR